MLALDEKLAGLCKRKTGVAVTNEKILGCGYRQTVLGRKKTDGAGSWGLVSLCQPIRSQEDQPVKFIEISQAFQTGFIHTDRALKKKL